MAAADGGAGGGTEPRSAPACPFCGSRQAEAISLFGSQAMTLQYRCRACASYYEAIKYDDEAPS
ncbi:MAG: hypothetical protein ACREPA_06310 [Candidatus Dormibacteraceae bacterium]